MPCAACGVEIDATQWKDDPLQWELDPPCSEEEWLYLASSKDAPEFMSSRTCVYMNKICKGCYGNRFDVMTRVRQRIRDRGGMQEMKPTQKMQREYEAAHEGDIVARRPARIHGLQSAAVLALNGQYCKLISKDPATERWTVELLDSTQKSVKEGNLEVSKDIDSDFEVARLKWKMENAGTAGANSRSTPEAVPRPLGQKTTWPKVKGIHPGAVVRLQGLSFAALNGRSGRCISFNPDSGRWTVDLGDEQKALKIDNLVPAPGEKPPTKQGAEEETRSIREEGLRREAQSAKERHAEDYGWDG